MFKRLRVDKFISPDINEHDPLSYWRVRILTSILLSGVAIGTLVIISIIPVVIRDQLWGLLVADISAWILGVILLVSPKIKFKTRAVISILVMYALGLVIILSVGPLSGGPVWLFGFAILSGVLLGWRAACFAILTNAITIIVIGFLMINELWGQSFVFFSSSTAMYITGINFIYLNAIIAISVSVVVKGLTLSHEKQLNLSKSLKKEHVEVLNAKIKLDKEMLERRQADTALKESKKKYQNILESIEDGYFEVDLYGNFVFFNDSMCRILGYHRSKLMGMNHRSYMDKENAKKIFKAFNKVYRTDISTKALDWKLIRKDGSQCFSETIVSLIKDSDGNRIGFRGIARDITDKRQLEEQLLHAQKMESIGTLAGGIAHDFNNILHMILGNAELAIQDIPKANAAWNRVDKIKTASLKASGIVRQLLKFSRKVDQEFKSINAVAVVKEAVKFLKSTIPASIQIDTRLPDTEIIILADPVQIYQVLLNLCTNASQAMEETGGVLTITAQKISLDEKKVKLHPDLSAGDHLKITIKDTGPGISDDIADKIFDPYFTTKEVGKGSGLGLAIVHGIIQSHNGIIRLKSQIDKGTSFTIFFPTITGHPAIEVELSKQLPSGKESILFVDDEAIIADLSKKTLEHFGYRVETRLNPKEALDLFQIKPTAFDLVITDMTMPQMSGAELSEKILEIRPDIPIIICTGHSSLMDEKKAADMGISAFVMKPVEMQKMAKIIREVLDKKNLR